MLMDVKWYLTIVLIFIFLMINDIEHFFMRLLIICISLENVWVLFPVFNWVVFLLLRCKSSLYILKIIFSHFMGWLFILLIVSFDAQKFQILIEFNLPIFFFCFLCFWCPTQQIIAKFIVIKFPPMCSKHFIILTLTFRSLTHLS